MTLICLFPKINAIDTPREVNDSINLIINLKRSRDQLFNLHRYNLVNNINK